MRNPRGDIIVGILGQWASGKSTAAKTLIRHLGGKDEVVFISDRALLAAQVVDHIFGLDVSEVIFSVEVDGRRRLEGKHAVVYLDPGEDLKTVNLHTLLFDLYGDVAWDWLNRTKVEMGYRLREKGGAGKPIVLEAGFGPNTKPCGEKTLRNTISDLFTILADVGVEPELVKWIIVEAGYEKRSERNQKRPDSVPAVEFDLSAADGGDLDPAQQVGWEAKGTVIKRVLNNHDDIERFKVDIIAAFEEVVGESLPAGTAGRRRR